ncbi:hypothetical protein IscW_ISCW012669, partial [Ixodes scapularis]
YDENLFKKKPVIHFLEAMKKQSTIYMEELKTGIPRLTIPLPLVSNFDFAIHYIPGTNHIPLSYFGYIYKANITKQRTFYAIKVIPDAVRAFSDIFMNSGSTPDTAWSSSTVKNFSSIEQCVYDFFGYENLPINKNEIKNMTKLMHSLIAELLMLPPTYQLFQKVREKASENDRGFTERGFSPLLDPQIFNYFLVESSCVPTSNAKVTKNTLLQIGVPVNTRINKALSSWSEFSNIFQCPSTAKMNLKKELKCDLYTVPSSGRQFASILFDE